MTLQLIPNLTRFNIVKLGSIAVSKFPNGVQRQAVDCNSHNKRFFNTNLPGEIVYITKLHTLFSFACATRRAGLNCSSQLKMTGYQIGRVNTV